MTFTAPANQSPPDLASNSNLQVQQRLIAVWALAEGFLGGILHGLHLPVTGLVVGSVSVCCLALLSRVATRRGDILKATLLVMLVKAMLSPHSPPMAYFAVFSQGLLAQLLFSGSRFYKLNCFLLAVLTQLQSAIQHLMVVVVVFGLDLWQALDQYLNKITGSLGLAGFPFALYLAAGYVFLHLLAGIFVGWFASQLPAWLHQRAARLKTPGFPAVKPKPEMPAPELKKTGRKRLSVSFLFIWLLLAAVFLQSYFGLGPAILPKAKAAQIVIRSVLIVSIWYFVVSPFLMAYFHKWLSRRQGPLQTQLLAVQTLLPQIRVLVQNSWTLSARFKGLARLRFFVADAGTRLFAVAE